MIKGKAYAKINLFLDITGRADNGFHNIDTLFMPVTLADEFTYEANDDGDIRLSCSEAEFANDSNTIVKAYRLVKDIRPCLMGLDVDLKKNIPSGAGLGGGSADAASFLTSINMKLGLHLNIKSLMEIGAKVGADVPACMVGMPSVGSGTGAKLKTLGRDYLKLYMVIIKPEFGFNTAAMYRRFDELLAKGKIISQKGSCTAAAQALISKNYKVLCDNLYNVFEQVVPEPAIIEQVKNALITEGADAAMMTGSGSAVFGLFESGEKARAAMERLSEKYEAYYAESF